MNDLVGYFGLLLDNNFVGS